MLNLGVQRKPFFISIPHSGESVPEETPWLKGLPETLLMCDVDRFVDRLYAPVLEKLEIPFVKTEWHRYAIDLNRLADDVDQDSVRGHENPSGRFPRGLHWSITTKGEKLMPEPISSELHDLLVQKYFEPFHSDVRTIFMQLKQKAKGTQPIYHLDAHSMPSMGTKEHLDPGQRRAEIVVSDCDGKSCSAWFKDLVVQSYADAGFQVGYNWPYKGGRVTQTYGRPNDRQESIQVELNRALYMNEENKRLREDLLPEVQEKLKRAVEAVYAALPSF
jgi:N-formylglutamate deformylase